MFTFIEYENYDGMGLAQLVKQKEISPQELQQAVIERVNKYSSFNFLTRTMYDEAKIFLKSVDPKGPFFGVPTFLKDLLAHYATVPTTAGSKALLRNIKDTDSEIV